MTAVSITMPTSRKWRRRHRRKREQEGIHMGGSYFSTPPILLLKVTATLILPFLALFFYSLDALAYSNTPQPPRSQQQRRKPPLTFQEFEFASNGVCLFPQLFVEQRPIDDDKQQQAKSTNYFTMRNVPGDGDCMFLAVALAAATSMGLGANDALLRAISRETRSIVAQILNSDGNLYISPGQVVEASKLLQSAVKSEPGIDTETEYLEALRKEGREGGLYGGGPELAVLANVLRRPISIYEVDKPRLTQLMEETISDEKSPKIQDTLSPASMAPDGATMFPIVCKGSFGEGIFEDPCLTSIPNSAVLSNMQPGAYSWRLNILVLTVSPGDKHACVLLPQTLEQGENAESR